MRLGVLLLIVARELEEGAESSLLEQSEQSRRQRFRRRRGNLVHLSTLHDERTRHALELQVLRHRSVQQYLDEVAASHEELGAQIDAVVACTTHLLRRLSARTELLVQLLEVQTRAFTT